MIRRFVRAVIHNATVTQSQSGWPVSVRIDPILLRAADVLAFEEVEIVNVATGARFTTWAEPGIEGSGEVAVSRVRPGDIVTISSLGWLHDGQTLTHRAKVITLDSANRILSLEER